MLLWPGDDTRVDLGRGQAEVVFAQLADRISDYGRSEFYAGRADATEYVRAQMLAETHRDRLLVLLRSVIYREGTNAD